MSYDVHLEIDTGGTSKAIIEDCGNYTYNVSPMFYKAMPEGLTGLRGKTGLAAIPILANGISEMTHPDKVAEYEKMNPKNGWGDRASAVAFLQGILESCRRHPKAMLEIT